MSIPNEDAIRNAARTQSQAATDHASAASLPCSVANGTPLGPIAGKRADQANASSENATVTCGMLNRVNVPAETAVLIHEAALAAQRAYEEGTPEAHDDATIAHCEAAAALIRTAV